MTVLYANNAGGTIATGINNSVTTIALTAGHGARFPNPTLGDYFYVTLIDASNNLEIIKVTARSSDTLTVVRAAEGTTARSFLALDKIELRPTAAGFADIQNQLNHSGQLGLYGLTLSNATGFLTTRITVSAGQCRDNTNTKDLVLATPITKDLITPWAVGTAAGGKDTGTLTAAQTWHVFLMTDPTAGVTDVIFSQSPTAPALPTGYTYYRRLGAVLLEAASTSIRQFIQDGDWFKLKIRSTDFAAQSNAGGPFLRQITVPTGVKVEAELYFQSTGTVDGGGYLSGIYDPDFGTPPAFGVPTQWAQIRRIAFYNSTIGTSISYVTQIVRQFTDSSRQVYTYSNDPADVILLGVLGWRDRRGQ